MIDLVWLLVCSGLVFLMQPGFMCLESGLTRSKNSINVAVKNLADFGISVGLFWAMGYALMFGASKAGIFGSTYFFIDVGDTPALAAFFLFQTMFCSTATTIVSGAVAERMRFQAYLIVATLVSGLIYPIFGHWAWNGIDDGSSLGWLSALGFVDFAGSTVVHSIGGWVALAALLVIGPRTGRFPKGERPRKIHGSNLPLSVLGAMLLWLGWLGFNGGSTLVLSDRVPIVIVNTVLAGVSGMLSAMAIGGWRKGVVEVESMINGSIAGLVAITASCNVVGTAQAVAIGAVGSAIAMAVSRQLVRWRIDDAVDAVAVHVGAGVWGTLAVAFFGRPELLQTGLNPLAQLGVQVLGIASAAIWGFGLSLILIFFIDRRVPLRISRDGEKVGLNISEHRAKSEIYELFQVMDFQARTKDLSLRVPVEPFTEVGQIAERYNQVMDALEEAVRTTDAIVETATDAILTFAVSPLIILTANPSAEAVFGYPPEELIGMEIDRLVSADIDSKTGDDALIRDWLEAGLREGVGWRADGSGFPVEVTVTEAKLGARSLLIGTFRDISDRKQAEESLASAYREIQVLNDRLRAENQSLNLELEITRRLQRMLLPTEAELEKIKNLDIAGYMEPATEIGGDYYDVLASGGNLTICMGDVTGHGLESGMVMLMAQTAVRTLLEAGETDPVRFLDILNRTIYLNVVRMNCDKNMTLVLLDYQDGELRVCGQHEEAIVVRENGAVERIETIDLGFPIGLVDDISEFIDHFTTSLNPGDVVVLYTDGITEAENCDRVHYGIERLCEIVTQNRDRTAAEIRKSIIDDVLEHIANHEVYDDMTLLVCKQRAPAKE